MTRGRLNDKAGTLRTGACGRQSSPEILLNVYRSAMHDGPDMPSGNLHTKSGYRWLVFSYTEPGMKAQVGHSQTQSLGAVSSPLFWQHRAPPRASCAPATPPAPPGLWLPPPRTLRPPGPALLSPVRWQTSWCAHRPWQHGSTAYTIVCASLNVQGLCSQPALKEAALMHNDM